MAAETTTTSDALELAARLDCAVLFLGFLGETPWFAHQRKPLGELLAAVAEARDDVQSRHGIHQAALERRQGALMRELGLLGESGCHIDPGFGRDVAQLDEQLRQLAERVIGVQWDHSNGCYLSSSTSHSYV